MTPSQACATHSTVVMTPAEGLDYHSMHVFPDHVMTTNAFILVAILCVSATTGAADSSLLPIPSLEEVQKAERKLKADYKDEYQSARIDPDPLLRELSEAAETATDPTVRFAVLLQLEDVAARRGDFAKVIQLIDDRARIFDCDGISESISIVEKLRKDEEVRKDIGCLLGLYRLAEQAAYRALRVDRLVDAEAAAESGRDVAKALVLVGKSTKQSGLVSDSNDKQARSNQLIQSLGVRKKRQTEFLKAKEDLMENPDDARLNMTVGRYACFVLGQRDKGLPCLAKCGEPEIEDLARKELDLSKAENPASEKYAEIGGLWWELAEKQPKSKSELTADIKMHAAALYELAKPGLKGNDLREAVNRIKDASPEGSPGKLPKGFFKIHRLVARKNAAEGWGALLKEIEFIDETGKRLRDGKASAAHPPEDSAAAEASAMLAFDGSEKTAHGTSHEPVKNGYWISYEMPYPVKLGAVRILQIGGGNHLYDMELQGSNDGETWTKIGLLTDLPDDSGLRPLR